MRSESETGTVGSHSGPIGNLASEGARPSRKQSIDPAVKAWLENVLVPAMVHLYLAQQGTGVDNGVVSPTERVQ